MPNERTGASIDFTFEGKQLSLALPEAASNTVESVFLMGLPKAGSTLLNRIMQPLCKAVGLTPFGLHAELRRLGIAPARSPRNADALFVPHGYVYAGFRSFPYSFPIPGFASGRTVLLVRDPRDMLVSLYFSHAKSHAAPGSEASESLLNSFNAQRAEAQSQDIRSYVLGKVGIVENDFARMERKLVGIDHKVWRYEDIIFDKLRWTNEMLDYLGLELPQRRIEAVVERNDIKPQAEASSEHIRKVTPGDHKEKLDSETIAELNQALRPILDRYQYAT